MDDPARLRVAFPCQHEGCLPAAAIVEVFYCLECDRSFCGEHWDVKRTFDWGFDHYSGACSVGHPHFIDHCQAHCRYLR